jgi:hypothetical protein
MSALGNLGRFGNQVIQYGFLRLVANASGAIAQCPDWAGTMLFGNGDPPVATRLPVLLETGGTFDAAFNSPAVSARLEQLSGMPVGRIGPDALKDGSPPGELVGFFQYHTSHYRPFRDEFRSLFRPREELGEWLDEPVAMAGQRGRTLVVIHLRSGDYKWLPNLTFTLSVPPEWWVEWLEDRWGSFDSPILYVCTDDVAGVRRHFRKFEPITEADLSLAPPAIVTAARASFYRDYHMMTQADVLGIGNSTFSFSAAMMNERARLFVRPHFDFSTRFTEFDPWDADPLLHLKGRNPFFKDYTAMLDVAKETQGVRGMIACALLYHPVGSAFVLRERFKLGMGAAVLEMARKATRRFSRLRSRLVRAR